MVQRARRFVESINGVRDDVDESAENATIRERERDVSRSARVHRRISSIAPFFYEKADRTDFSLIHFLFSWDHVRPARTGVN